MFTELHDTGMNNPTIIVAVCWLYCSIGALLSVREYAESYKANQLTETCEEPEFKPVLNCGNEVTLHSLSYSNTFTLNISWSDVCEGSDALSCARAEKCTFT